MGVPETIFSERDFRRADFLIFVTVGNHNQPFDRLLKWIDEIALEGIFKEEFFVQSGYSHHSLKYCSSTDFLRMEDFEIYVKTSSAVITHAGTGSVMMSLRSGKKPIVIPRLYKFNEHCNDHQIGIALEFEKKGLIYVAKNKGDIINQLKASLTKNSQVSGYESRNQTLLKIVEQYLDNLFKDT